MHLERRVLIAGGAGMKGRTQYQYATCVTVRYRLPTQIAMPEYFPGCLPERGCKWAKAMNQKLVRSGALRIDRNPWLFSEGRAGQEQIRVRLGSPSKLPVNILNRDLPSQEGANWVVLILSTLAFIVATLAVVGVLGLKFFAEA